MNHVLVVDGDPAIGKLVCEALTAHGLGAERVQTDLAAYRRIPALPTLNALILDVPLGTEVAGFDVARFARQVIPEVALFFIGGRVTQAALRAQGIPDSAVIEKPFLPDELASLLVRTTSSGLV